MLDEVEAYRDAGCGALHISPERGDLETWLQGQAVGERPLRSRESRSDYARLVHPRSVVVAEFLASLAGRRSVEPPVVEVAVPTGGTAPDAAPLGGRRRRGRLRGASVRHHRRARNRVRDRRHSRSRSRSHETSTRSYVDERGGAAADVVAHGLEIRRLGKDAPSPAEAAARARARRRANRRDQPAQITPSVRRATTASSVRPRSSTNTSRLFSPRTGTSPTVAVDPSTWNGGVGTRREPRPGLS